ncbi:protein argonaute-2-like [Bolinopsis microptera]|uniref:protein argonaute-2-like n=1 Tax=Bolinopsis microptera TaxID=2820187 RepID=UPI003079A3BF
MQSSSGTVTPPPKNKMIRQNATGTKGRNVALISNSFQINFKKPSLSIFQFDLSIVNPNRNNDNNANSVPSRGVCDEVYKQLNLGAEWAYDGKKNLYSPSGEGVHISRKIKLGRTEFEVEVQGPVAKTSVQEILDAIRTVGGVIPIGAVNALNIVLSQGFNNGSYVTVKRNFFNSGQRAPDFPGGLKLYSGISASITPSKDFGITIKVLKTHQVMYPGGTLLEFVKSHLENSSRGGGGRGGNSRSQLPRSLDQKQIRYFNGILKGLKVETNHLGYKRKYTITGVHNQSANSTIIEDLNISVAKYFQGSYKNVKLVHLDLPLVKAGGKTKIPMELCTLLPNQPYFTTLDSAQQRDMIRKACQKPEEKMKDIQQSAEEVSKVTSGFTGSNYGFQINPKAIELNGRVLDPPKMDPNPKNSVHRGAWTMSAVQKSGEIPVKVKLGFVCLLPKPRYTKELHDRFLEFIFQRARALKINIAGETPPFSFSTIQKLGPILQGMQSAYNFIILDNDESTYGKVKLTELCTKRTQCIKFQTIEKVCGINSNPRNNKPAHPDMNTMDNILKKLNAKIGGVNFGINIQGLPQKIFNEPVMIVGADVTHFTRSDQKPSIAAVVATSDPSAAKYISRVKALYPEGDKMSVEYIRDMKDVMVSILREFIQVNRRPPGKIIYYRDGVSEGQFENTVMEELGGIQDACTELKADYKPRISVVVCTKRHKQRFVVKKGGRVDNMEPGTVVDTGVVSPNYMNFYLNSQQAIQGTNVPCHYYVLYDDNKLSIDMWQMLSFYLCHTYARCSRSVSYPAPVYYAHLACASARARMLSRYDWQEMITPEDRPSEQEIEQVTRPDKFNMFFI